MRLDYRETQLANGLRVATSSMRNVSSVTVGVWVGVGGRWESKKLSGVSHFIEHLLFKGTQKRSARQISQEIEGRGGYFNAFTQEESTCYYAKISSEYVEEVTEILADMYLHPRFAPEDIEKERGVIIEEIMMYRDQPHQLVLERLGELLWHNHPLGRPLIGTPKTVGGMTRADIMGHKRRYYIPENTVVVFAGDVVHEERVRHVRRLLGRAAARRARGFVAADKAGQLRADVIGKEVEQAHLALGVRHFGRHDRRRYALKILSVILGENMSSRLFQVVRERHGMAYSIHSSVHMYADTGVLEVSAGLDRKRAGRAIELVMRELRRFKEKAVSRHELRRAKDYAVGQMKIGLENSGSHMMWIGEHLLGYGALVQPEEVIKRLEGVSATDVQAVARQVLRPGRTSIALVTPDAGKQSVSDLSRSLRKLA